MIEDMKRKPFLNEVCDCGNDSFIIFDESYHEEYTTRFCANCERDQALSYQIQLTIKLRDEQNDKAFRDLRDIDNFRLHNQSLKGKGYRRLSTKELQEKLKSFYGLDWSE